MSIAIGQTDLLMAAAIVLGFRWPAAWLLPIITKVTPGIGLLWFAVRREWRALFIALGATFAVVAVSWAVDPGPGRAGSRCSSGSTSRPPRTGVFLPVPVWIRLPLVALLIAWGARTDRRWVLPIGVCFSLPTVWLNTPTILIAIAAAGRRRRPTTPAARWLRGSGRRPGGSRCSGPTPCAGGQASAARPAGSLGRQAAGEPQVSRSDAADSASSFRMRTAGPAGRRRGRGAGRARTSSALGWRVLGTARAGRAGGDRPPGG